MWKVCQQHLLLHIDFYEFLWLTDNRAYLQLLQANQGQIIFLLLTSQRGGWGQTRTGCDESREREAEPPEGRRKHLCHIIIPESA